MRDLERTDEALLDELYSLRARVAELEQAQRQRQQAEQALQQFRALVENSADFLGLTDMKGCLFYLNEAGCNLVGLLNLERFGPISLADLIVPEDRVAFREYVWPLILDKGCWQTEATLHHQKTGQPIHVKLQSFVITDPQTHQPLAVAILNHDWADYTTTDAVLRESEEQLRLAVKVTRLGTWVWDIENNLVSWSENTYKLFELDKTSFAGTYKAFLELMHSEDRDTLTRALNQTLASGAPYSVDFRIQRPDKSIRWMLAQGQVYCDDTGQPTRMIGTMQDITERKKAEEALRHSQEQLLQSQKMESIGRLAGGVAHDFNNLLTVISGYSDFLLNGLKENDPLRQDVLEIQSAASRATTLTRQLLAFSRRQVLQPQVVTLNVVVTEMHKLLRRLIGEDIELIYRNDPRPRSVRVDRGQFEQVLLNLAINARDAMSGGGKLRIETTNFDLDNQYTFNPYSDLKPGHYVVLTVSDTGAGMDTATQAHIFEPFFTTKERGKGTGLGLSTVYGIINQSGGYIWVSSEPGMGTTFKIFLPAIMEEQPVLQAPVISDDEPLQGSETILLVEDEELIRNLTRKMLEARGYTVLLARHGYEALELFKQHPDSIHLVITDVVMPHLGGPGLVEQLTTLKPAIKVLVMSGYSEWSTEHYGALGETQAFLPKPFTPFALAQKVREVLDTPAQSDLA
jgi:two-component system, cell cycle sensor histidine kinase and response regulator CckA